MQIPILNGVYTDENADFRATYPVNMIPVPVQSGISNGYLRPADGIVANGAGPGVSRGGINVKGVCFRVMGTKLVLITRDGSVSEIGDVGGTDDVTFDYSFDRLAVASNNNLFYYDGAILTQVTDPDLGDVIDVVWVDGYFMTTDGEFLVVTELSDPTQVNPLKYGSSEADPDPVKALLKVNNEVYALNRNTIEVFDNVGGEFFPFQRIEGAQIQKGVVGTHACCVFMNSIAFIGSGRNEAPSIYIGANSTTQKIATREIEKVLKSYSEDDLSKARLEAKNGDAHQALWVSLPDRTIVYDLAASQTAGEPVWYTLTSSITGFSEYRARDLVWCYERWLVGDSASSSIGYLDESTGGHFGDEVRWEFSTSIVYNNSNGAIFHELELIALTGRIAFGTSPKISTSYSVDGETWSQDRFISAGETGNRKKRLVWLQQGPVRNWRIQRFRGTSDAFISPARLEAEIEPLGY
jgi:hypothetical protein